MDKEFGIRVRCETRQLYCVLWQLECHSLDNEFNILFKIQAYWCEVSLDTRRVWEETIVGWENTHNKEWVRYDDKAITQGEVKKLYAESGLSGVPHMIWSGRFVGSSSFGGPKAQSPKSK